jgi:uncharacterized membrane protein
MRKLSIWVLALMFASAGVLHLLKPAPFVRIMPPFVPFPAMIVTLSGMAELFGAVGILIPASRRLAGWAVVLLLAAVLPANVYMAQQNIQIPGMPMSQWMLWLRLPLQFLLMWWVLAATTTERLPS